MDLPATERRAGDLALDRLTPEQLARAFQDADRDAVAAVAQAQPAVSRAIELAISGKVKLEELVSHRYALADTAQAYASNLAYEPGINKVILRVN